jgi:hypothetical protein
MKKLRMVFPAMKSVLVCPALFSSALALHSAVDANGNYIPAICVFRTELGLTDAIMPGLGNAHKVKLQVTEYWTDAIWNARQEALCTGAQSQKSDLNCLLEHFKWEAVSCALATNTAALSARNIRQNIPTTAPTQLPTVHPTLDPTGPPTPDYDVTGYTDWDAFMADPANGGTWEPTQLPTLSPTMDPTWSPTAPTPYRPMDGYLNDHYNATTGDAATNGVVETQSESAATP